MGDLNVGRNALIFYEDGENVSSLETMNWRIIRLNEISALSIFVGADTEARLRNLTPASRRAQFSVYNAIDQSTVSVAIKFKTFAPFAKLRISILSRELIRLMRVARNSLKQHLRPFLPAKEI